VAALSPPPFPEALAYLWDVFERLDAMRRVGFNGLERLAPADVQAGLELFHVKLDPHEVEALVLVDLAMLHPDLERTGEVSKTPPSQDTPWPEPKA
jgi:hypothetical protein